MGDGIGETYQYVPASPGIGDSAIRPYLTPEYRLLCPSGMTDWLCTARQSKKLTSIWSAMSEERNNGIKWHYSFRQFRLAQAVEHMGRIAVPDYLYLGWFMSNGA